MEASEFDEIRGYDDGDVAEVFPQCFSKESIHAFIHLVFPKWPVLFRLWLARKLRRWYEGIEGRIHTVDDFQRLVTAVAVRKILQKSASGFAVSGTEHLDGLRGCFFVSNHRDIILDAALFCYALFENGMETCYNAFGDNLISCRMVEDLLRLNKCFIVKRNLSMREQFFSSKLLSKYINRLLDDGHSVWIAQRDGRSKDGSDITKSTILKMLNFSKRNPSLSFKEMMDSYRIVPIAISYEYDPCDRMKARELCQTQATGRYVKKPYEDLKSMIAGIRGRKGRIALAIGEVVMAKEGQNEADIALEIDRAIHQNYHLWPTNYAAWDWLHHESRFAAYYTPKTLKRLRRRLTGLRPDEIPFLLLQYANPVQNKLNEGAPE